MLSALAQTRRIPRIGLLPEAGEAWRNLITQGLLELGWVEKRDYLLVELGLQYGKVQTEAAAKRMMGSSDRGAQGSSQRAWPSRPRASGLGPQASGYRLQTRRETGDTQPASGNSNAFGRCRG